MTVVQLDLNSFFFLYMLCVLTSQWVLCTLFAGQKSFVSALKQVFLYFSVTNRNKRKESTKIILFLKKAFSLSLFHWHPKDSDGSGGQGFGENLPFYVIRRHHFKQITDHFHLEDVALGDTRFDQVLKNRFLVQPK